jgi:pyruvyl transferase EpsO
VLGELLEGVSQVAILDFPHHRNFGDALIFCGEMTLLRRLGIKVVSVSDIDTYDPERLRKLPVDTVMLIHGGGNFGDLYPEHEQFRQRVLSDLVDRRVISLPQSLHFVDSAGIDDCRRSLEGHPDLTLTWRDRASFEFAQTHFPDCQSVLVPDMVLGLVPWEPPRTTMRPRVAVSILGRRDRETTGLRRLADEAGLNRDWSLAWPEKIVIRPVNWVISALGRRRGELADRIRTRAFIRHASILGTAAARQVCSAKLIVTDRLHATITALLLDVDVLAVHSLDHKLEHLLKTWLPDQQITILESALDAMELVGTRAEHPG